MKIIGGSPRLIERSSHPELSDENLGDGDVVDNGTCFCLFSGSFFTSLRFFYLCNVPDTVMEEEMNKLPTRKRVPPDADLCEFGSIELGFGTSLVSVGSMLYFIGGQKGGDANNSLLCGNEVRKFDTEISQFEVDQMPPHMNECRCFAAVVAIDRTIYVFGGLTLAATEDSSWAEYLNTDMPLAMQKWMPLKQPPFCPKLSFFPFAIPYDTDSILIADVDVSEGVLHYNVRDLSWMKYEFPSCIFYVSRPVSVVCQKTVYWISQMYMYAYDYEKHVLYRGLLRQILHVKDIKDSAVQGPYLMHLKDDIFCCFTPYATYHRIYITKTEILQCTTFKVTKTSSGCDYKDLSLLAMGYKSYRCGLACSMFGVLPIQKRICLSNTKKRGNGSKKKKNMQSHAPVPALG